MKKSRILLMLRLLSTLLLGVLILPPTVSAAAEEINPDKTDLPQPAELVSGDYAYVSDLYWKGTQAYSNGSGQRDTNCAGEYIWSCDLKKWPKGIGIHAASSSFNAYVDVKIEGLGYTRFATWYGICETLSGNDISMASVKFSIIGDGKTLFTSEAMRYNQPFAYTEVDVTGVKTLRLAIAGAPGISGAWGVWGGAVLSKSGNLEDVEWYQELIIDAPTAETTEPVTDPETEPATHPVTEPLTEPVTEPAADTPTEAEATTPPDENETQSGEGGCQSALGMGAIATTAAVAAIAAVAVPTQKRKEE